jgi:predicted GH43/DUF377 family glycosyl hydrolase
MKPDIIRRYSQNPILTKAEIPYPVETVHNAAVVKHEGQYIMLFRSHLRTGRSIIGLARSPDGFHFTADSEPFLVPARGGPFAAYEEFGVEDPRVTRLEGEYLITYSAYSRNGVRIALAKTKDFDQMERVSLITEADYRNAVIFPSFRRSSMDCMRGLTDRIRKSARGQSGFLILRICAFGANRSSS